MQILDPSTAHRELFQLLKRIPGIRPSAKDAQVSAAARLPKRVLVRIFREVRKTGGEDYFENRSWTVLGHVCRSWRAAAFDVPNIWAHNYMFSLKEEKNYGGRPSRYSATLDMDFDAKWTRIHRKRLVHLIFDECEWMQSLQVSGTQACNIMQNAKKPAPELKELILDSGDIKHKKQRIFGRKKTDSFMLPPRIFDGQLPALILLSLTNIIIDPTSPLLSANLITLVLSRNNEHCPRTCSLPQLLNVLSTMKRLSYLKVKDILTEPEDEASLKRSLSHIPRVYLLGLKELDLQIPSMHNYTGFLDKVQFRTRSTRFNLDTTIDVSRIQSFRMLPRGLAINPPTDPRLQEVKLCIETPQRLSFYASGAAGSLRLKIEDSAAFTSLLYLCFPLRKPLSAVRSLTLSSEVSMPGKWSLFWEYLPGVESLCVDCWDLPCLMDALARPDIFPKLARLEFSNPLTCPADSFAVLADALEKRLQGGRSLKLLLWKGPFLHEVVPCQTVEDIAKLRQRRAPSAKQAIAEALAALRELQNRAEGPFQATGDV